MKTHTSILLALALAACASPQAPVSATAQSESKAESKSNGGAQLAQAATTPLNDLNLVHAEIPAVLAEARKGPYLPPPNSNCAELTSRVQALDAALGPDLDAPVTPSNPGLVERGGAAAGHAAVGALRGAAEGVIPFRSWVRKLSGAERYSKEVAAAIAAGTVRRAYLKGLGQAAGCEAPAAPLRS